MNRTLFQKHLTLIGTATNKELTPALSDLWWRKFGALPDDVLIAAFELVIDTCKFFPAPAEFNDLLRQVATSRGAVVDGASAWDECERLIFRQWSEAGDRLVLSSGQGYPWPNLECKATVREKLNLTVRAIATMHPKDYDATRERFINAYDAAQAVERAEAQIAGPTLRALPEAGD